MRLKVTLTGVNEKREKLEGWEYAEGTLSKVIQIPDGKTDVIDRCVGLMAKADKLSAEDIIDCSEYAFVQTWDDEDIKECLEEMDCDCSKESIERVADMLHRMDDDQILEDALKNADIPQKKSLNLLRSLVSFMYEDCMEKEDAEAELYEMGLTDELLHYLGFYGEGEYKLPDMSEEDIIIILINVIFWFKQGCVTEEHARAELEEMGFDEEFLEEYF